MRIVLTGVTGQVGKALTGMLGKLGHLIPADRSVLNLAEPRRLPKALDRLAPDLILNPAAYTAVDRAEEDRELAFTVNAEAPAVMARWALDHRVPLIHFSTDYVFSGDGQTPWREDSPTGPLSAYGASKLAGEDALRAIGGPHLIVRTSWVYAAQGTNFLRTIARLAQERIELKVVADQVGAPTSASVIGQAVTGLLSSDFSHLRELFARADGLVNIAASGETSWYGFAARIVEGLRARGVPVMAETVLPLRTEEYPTKATRPRNSRFDLSRLYEVFGLTTPMWDVALEPELDLIAKEIRDGLELPRL